jgi:hypothetical protein
MSPTVRRPLAVLVSAAAMTALITVPHALIAQESAKGKAQGKGTSASPEPTTAPEKPAAGKVGSGRVAPPDPTHRVPPGYARLGLTDQQKDRLYRIQAEYYPKIQALQKQLDTLRDDRDARCEAVLSREQKQLLKQEIQQKKAASEARKALNRAATDEKAGKE